MGCVARGLKNTALTTNRHLHCPKSNPNVRDITWNVEDNEILHVIFRVVVLFSNATFHVISRKIDYLWESVLYRDSFIHVFAPQDLLPLPAPEGWGGGPGGWGPPEVLPARPRGRLPSGMSSSVSYSWSTVYNIHFFFFYDFLHDFSFISLLIPPGIWEGLQSCHRVSPGIQLRTLRPLQAVCQRGAANIWQQQLTAAQRAATAGPHRLQVWPKDGAG